MIGGLLLEAIRSGLVPKMTAPFAEGSRKKVDSRVLEALIQWAVAAGWPAGRGEAAESWEAS